ncbi:XRE family transcriptional regulator [Actinoplanes sp. N902-109]|nr:XRE family transcriptional regulator [Actinoplanes sp. N902-109]
MSQPKISRLERGVGAPDPADVAKVARALGADDQMVASLMDRAERSHDRMTDWRAQTAGFTAQQDSVSRWELSAQWIREFHPNLVPGLLQSSGYAAAALKVMSRVRMRDVAGVSDADVAMGVSARVRRQERLLDPTKSFHFLITEAALRHQVCPAAEMLAQLQHIRDVSARRDSVTIEVLADGAEIEVPPLHGFMVLDESLIIIEAYHAALVSSSRKDVTSYLWLFDVFARHASPVGPFLDKYEEYYIEQLSRRSRAKP